MMRENRGRGESRESDEGALNEGAVGVGKSVASFNA